MPTHLSITDDMRRAFRLAAAVLFCTALFTAVARPATTASFEAADIHPSAPGATPGGGVLPGGRIEFHATTLLGLITSSWGITASRVAGGPSWIDSDRFELVAKAPSGTSRLEMRAMLRNLLAERFGLVVKTEEKPQPVYALVLGKHKPPQEAKPGDPSCDKNILGSIISLACRNTTMGALADNLTLVAAGYFGGSPVVDRTNLPGEYDFRLEWMARTQLPAGPEGLKDARSLYSVLDRELGLAVEPQTAPVTFVSVVHVNRTPSPNPPGVLSKLGKLPTEFEVADLKISRSSETANFKMSNGRLEAKSIPLRDLIAYAYKVQDDALKGGDKWLSSTRYDLLAKTVPTASEDLVRSLLQALLQERFGLKIHTTSEPLNVYALTAVKPRLKPADPAGRSGCTPSLVNGRVSYACLNVTMAQFCEKLQTVAVGYLDHPLVDLSGLTGSYDFNISWAPVGQTVRRPAPSAAGGEGPVDPNAELTVFEAVERQLGLKLALRKQPMPAIVIDHIERKASDN